MLTADRFSSPAGSSWFPWIVNTGMPTFRLLSSKLACLHQQVRPPSLFFRCIPVQVAAGYTGRGNHVGSTEWATFHYTEMRVNRHSSQCAGLLLPFSDRCRMHWESRHCDSEGQATPWRTPAKSSAMSVRKAAAAMLCHIGTSGCKQSTASTAAQSGIPLMPACLCSKLSICWLRIWKVMGLLLRECFLMISMALTRVVREGLFSWNRSPASRVEIGSQAPQSFSVTGSCQPLNKQSPAADEV